MMPLGILCARVVSRSVEYRGWATKTFSRLIYTITATACSARRYMKRFSRQSHLQLPWVLNIIDKCDSRFLQPKGFFGLLLYIFNPPSLPLRKNKHGKELGSFGRQEIYVWAVPVGLCDSLSFPFVFCFPKEQGTYQQLSHFSFPSCQHRYVR